MAGTERLDPAQLTGVVVDPKLVLMVFMEIAQRQGKRRSRDLDLHTACAAAYLEFMGMEDAPDEEEVDDVHLPVLAALAMRVAALSRLSEGGHLNRLMSPPTAEGLEMIAEAACAATMLERNGEPAFQLLDFLGHLERAERDRSA